MDMTTIPIQLKADRIYQVISEAECVDMKYAMRDGVAWAVKFIFTDGTVLYVPVSVGRIDQPRIPIEGSAGPMTA